MSIFETWFSIYLNKYSINESHRKIQQLEERINLLIELNDINNKKLDVMKELINGINEVNQDRDESINKKLQLIYHDQDVMFDELMDIVKMKHFFYSYDFDSNSSWIIFVSIAY